MTPIVLQVETATQEGISLDYDKDGLPSAIVQYFAKAGEKLSKWEKTKFDRKGRPTEVTDYSGMQFFLGYDRTGNVASSVQKTPGGNLGHQIKRDDQNRIETVASFWGDTACTHEKDGSLKRIVGACAGRSDAIALAAGKVLSSTGFGGVRADVKYQESGPGQRHHHWLTWEPVNP